MLMTGPYFHFSVVHNKTMIRPYEILSSGVMTPILNVCKPKELEMDFKKVEIVTKYNYLGTVFGNKLRWDDNTVLIVMKCHKVSVFSWKTKLIFY